MTKCLTSPVGGGGGNWEHFSHFLTHVAASEYQRVLLNHDSASIHFLHI